MKKILYSIFLFLSSITIIIFFRLFFEHTYSEIFVIIVIFNDICINLMLSLYLSQLINEYIAKEIYRCKLVGEKSKVTGNVFLFLMIIFYSLKNTLIQYRASEYLVLMSYLITMMYSVLAIYTISYHLYVNDHMIFSIQYNKKIEINKIKNFKLNVSADNVYLLEILTYDDKFTFKLSKFLYQSLVTSVGLEVENEGKP